MTTTLVRTIILYSVLLAAVRLMGKRQIGQLQAGEFVAALLISELAAIPMTDHDIPLSHGLIPLLTVTVCEVALAFCSQKSKKLRRLLDGQPIELVRDGKYITKNLEKARVTEDEIDAQIRLKGYADISQVKTVTLEQSGGMSVLPNDSAGGSK